ncbi:MAG: protein phosphatase CheZ [Nitrospiraceae bacterium]
MQDDIQKNIEELRRSRGNFISIKEISEIVGGILTSVRGDISGADLKIFHEIQSLAGYIDATKADLAQICPNEINDEHLQVANNELDAIIVHTEEATGAILDACECLENMAGELDEKPAKVLNEAVTKIYEACSFQDITGQRITRVIQALTFIEEKVGALIEAFGDAGDALVSAKADEKVNGESDKKEDKILLNGPQLPEDAQSQEDIDKLLASFE